MLEDPPTVRAGGLLPHRRLGEVWDSPHRDRAHRYPHHLQQVFLRLMERFELTYRVPELTAGEPLSLVAQLVPAGRPDLGERWERYRPGDAALTHVCRILERGTDRQTVPEGLVYRLIVLFHRYSLGREDTTASAHWQGGMVLQDRYGARAMISLGADGLSVQVRGPYPQSFLHHLVAEVRDYVEDFWKGLTTRVMVPCRPPCGLDAPGRGLFDVDKLIARRDRGRTDFPCPVPDCDYDAEIDALLLGLEVRGRTDSDRLAAVVREAMQETIDSDIVPLLHAQATSSRTILDRLDDLDDGMKAAFSRAEERLAVLMRGLDDDAADGPRLFSLVPLDRTVLRPGWTSRRMRLTLWCEHSRLPVHVLDPDRRDAGVYTVEVPREWWVKAAPVIKATSIVLKTLLPVSLSAAELDLTASQWAAVKEQLAFTKESLTAVSEAGQKLPSPDLDGDELAGVVATPGEWPTRAEGGLLRMLHATLKEQDVTFADLRRVRDQQGRFLWVHPRYVPVYQPPLPEIPT